MTKNSWFSIVVISLAIVLCLVFLVGEPVQANEPIYLPSIQSGCPADPDQKWEYLFYDSSYIYGPDTLEQAIIYHGNLGWELVDVFGQLLIFKRPK